MKLDTIKKLVEINNRFYQTVGKYFDAARNYSWPGWDLLINNKHLPTFSKNMKYKILNTKYKILDVGCGNGRLFEFFRKELPDLNIQYTGIDGSLELLSKAKERIQAMESVSSVNESIDHVGSFDMTAKRDDESEKTIIGEHELLRTDLVFDNWPELFSAQKFDLITLFGVLHHIPDQRNRIEILERVRDLLAPDGRIILTTWMFLDMIRLDRRVIKKNTDDGIAKYEELGVDISELEENDYILDWHRGMVAYRYCHYTSKEEMLELLDKVGLKLLDSYLSDGKEDTVNKYHILALR